MDYSLEGFSVPPLKQVLLVTEHAVPSAPIFSLARELNRLGVETPMGDSVWSSTRRWMKLALQNELMVFVLYNSQSPFFQRQVYRARMLGCRAIRWWVGSDVMWACESEEAARAARALDEAVELNIAVSPHLVEELAEIGIEAEYIPSPCDLRALTDAPQQSLPRGVLTYLPAGRKAFYGESVLIAAIEANPDLDFYIVSDDSHSLSHYSNVTSLGWVDNMEPVWSRIGLLLRITQHDGMPRMVLEALARGRYVIYSERFDGCWYAKNAAQVQQHIDRYRGLTSANAEGPRVARSISVNAGAQYAERIAELHQPVLSPQRLGAMVSSVMHIR